MQLKNIRINKNTLLIAYKLSYDLLLLLLVTFALILISEGLLPEFVSSKVSLTKVGFTIFITLGIIAYLGNTLKITYKNLRISRNKILPLIVLFSFLLIGNSLLNFTLWENLIITTITLFIFFLFFEIIFIEKK